MDQLKQVAYFTRQYSPTPTHTFVLIHGLITSSKCWDKLEDQLFLKNQNIRTLSVDLRGFGKSNHITKVEKLSNFVDDVHGVILGVCKNESLTPQDVREKFTLVGWSFGGLVAQFACALHPDYYQRSILIASTSMHSSPLMRVDAEQEPTNERIQTREEVENYPFIKQFNDAIRTQNFEFFRNSSKTVCYNEGPVPSELERDLLTKESFLQTNYLDVMWIIQDYDLRPMKDQIKGPVLIIHGKQDLVVPYSSMEDIQSNLGKDKVKLVPIDPAGHMLPIIVPEQIAQLMFEFIQ